MADVGFLETLSVFTPVFTVVGGIVTVLIALKLLLTLHHILRLYLFSGIIGLAVNFKKCGQWAVVTGATDGIGKAYAHEFASYGMDIVLISRTNEKLMDVAKEIETRHKVKTKIVAVDFTKTDIYGTISNEIKALDIGVLVNNVGMGYVYPEYFLDIPDRDDFIMKIIPCNMTSVTMMTSIVLPQMVEKKKGVVINVSSASGSIPTPLLSVYAATKAYVDSFSQGLHVEYRCKGLIIQSVMPFFVATKMSRIRQSNFAAPDPTTFVKGSMATIGRERRTNGCFSHYIQGALLKMPENLHMTLTKIVLGVRRVKFLKKKAQKNE